MPTKIFIAYRLKPETSVDEFLEWSRTVDEPTTRSQPEVHDFQILLADGYVEGGVEADAAPSEPRFTVFEHVVVDSWDAWCSMLEKPAIAPLLAKWKSWADTDSAVTMHAALPA